eukprot:7311423-Pyramimonas_sp.AAC.1
MQHELEGAKGDRVAAHERKADLEAKAKVQRLDERASDEKMTHQRAVPRAGVGISSDLGGLFLRLLDARPFPVSSSSIGSYGNMLPLPSCDWFPLGKCPFEQLRFGSLLRLAF